MKALKYIAAHLLWLVNALFGLWLVFLSRNTWLAAFNQFYINGSPTRVTRAGLYDRVLSIILGIIWFLMVIYFETYFVNGMLKSELLKRFAKATGPIVVAFFVVDCILALIQGLPNMAWSRLVIMLVELVLGIALLRFGWVKTTAPKPVGQESGKS